MLTQIQFIADIIRLLKKARPGLPFVPRLMNAIIRAADSILDEVSAPTAHAWKAWGWRPGFAATKPGPLPATWPGYWQAGRPRATNWPGRAMPDDFGRCLGLFRAVPCLRPRMGELATNHGPQWAALAGAWDELEGLWQQAQANQSSKEFNQRLDQLLASGEPPHDCPE